MRLISAILMVLALAAGVPVSAKSNSSSRQVTKTFKINSFNAIDACMGIKVVLTPGKFNGKAEVHTTESGAQYLSVRVEGSTLKASYKFPDKVRNVSVNGPTVIYVTAPSLRYVDLSSSAKLEVESPMTVSGSLTLDLSSSGSVYIPSLKVDNMKFDLSSSSSAKIPELRANKVNFDTSSSSKAIVNTLTANEVEIDSSSSSNVTIGSLNARELDVESSSSSSVSVDTFNGNTLDLEASSSSKVKFAGAYASSLKADATTLSKITVNRLDGKRVSAEASTNATVTVNGKANSWSKDSNTGGKVYFNSSSVNVDSRRTAKPSKTSKTTKKSKSSTRSRSSKGSPTQAP